MTTTKATSKKKAALKNTKAAKSLAGKSKSLPTGGKAPAKKKPGRPTGKVDPATTRHKRNKNNLTDQEQKFADAILTNKNGETATDLVLKINPRIKRASARVVASNWMADERINAYMNIMRERVENKVEYDLVKWRADVLELIEIGMGRQERPQVVSMKNEAGELVKIQLDGVKEFEGNVAKGALELIAKQMKLLTDKTELDIGDQLREIFSKVTPTTGPPSQRGKLTNDK